MDRRPLSNIPEQRAYLSSPAHEYAQLKKISWTEISEPVPERVVEGSGGSGEVLPSAASWGSESSHHHNNQLQLPHQHQGDARPRRSLEPQGSGGVQLSIVHINLHQQPAARTNSIGNRSSSAGAKVRGPGDLCAKHPTLAQGPPPSSLPPSF